MQLMFLGTAASEGFPDAFCGCDNCLAARAAGGRSLRKRSSALIDNQLLIDLGPDLMAAAQIHQVPLDRMAYCLQTHDHADHLDPSHLLSRSTYSGVNTAPQLAYYASSVSLAKIAETLQRRVSSAVSLDTALDERLNLRIHQIRPGQHFEVGPYRVTSIAASHAPEAMLFLIERDQQCLFYATDTGPLSEEAWQMLAAHDGPIHMVALDHTFGFKQRSLAHLNAEQFQEQIARMREQNLLADRARIFAHHLGHHSHPAHDQLVDYAASHGYEVAYDGLQVMIG
ncbi:MAG: MBL fold metallo-hydrolase [Roseiflexaceae bacterium]|nr:MBL fold metallo-hydrolase [Roseiflexaceae bacterium]